jgi:hypothetical protein
MSGCNYNVSVAQVLESEKRLKILNLLRLKCSVSEFQISVLSAAAYDFVDTPQSKEVLETFPSLFESIANTDIGTNDASVLMYIAGYVSHPVGKKTFLLNFLLSTANNLQYELPSDACEYLSLINRGGLKWPTEFTVALCSNTFMLFKEILLNHEPTFLNCANQRNTLTNLTLNVLHGNLRQS